MLIRHSGNLASSGHRISHAWPVPHTRKSGVWMGCLPSQLPTFPEELRPPPAASQLPAVAQTTCTGDTRGGVPWKEHVGVRRGHDFKLCLRVEDTSFNLKNVPSDMDSSVSREVRKSFTVEGSPWLMSSKISSPENGRRGKYGARNCTFDGFLVPFLSPASLPGKLVPFPRRLGGHLLVPHPSSLHSGHLPWTRHRACLLVL